MTVCVLDVGGGTADITVHDVEERGGRTVLAEALHAVGALAGSVYVDAAFRWVVLAGDQYRQGQRCSVACIAQLLRKACLPVLCGVQGALPASGGRGCI